jgi:putative transposase
MPIAVIVAGANRHDMKLLAATWDAAALERPAPGEEAPHQVCLDQGYDYEACRQAAESRGYLPHIRSRGEEAQEQRANPGYRPRRWVVEVCHSWLTRFRKILVRVEKKLATHLALLPFACASIVLKRAGVFR